MALEGDESFDFTHDGVRGIAFRRGEGSAAAGHEIPGIPTPVGAFASRGAESGFAHASCGGPGVGGPPDPGYEVR